MEQLSFEDIVEKVNKYVTQNLAHVAEHLDKLADTIAESAVHMARIQDSTLNIVRTVNDLIKQEESEDKDNETAEVVELSRKKE